jgi:hypothetical protein
MDAIADLGPERYRACCQIQALIRAEQRGLNLDAADIAEIEGTIEATRQAWIIPGRDRYGFSVRHRGVRCWVVYDARIRCVVTIVRNRRFG